MAAQYITKVKTESGTKQIDYLALANLPQPDVTLTKSGSFADAKAVGDKFNDMASNVGISEDGSTFFGNADSEYRISVGADGITFWNGTTQVANIKDNIFTSLTLVGAVYE